MSESLASTRSPASCLGAIAPMLLAALVAITLQESLSASELQFQSPSQELFPDSDVVSVRTRFDFRNAGGRPISITGIKSSCSCTAATAEKAVYLPGESGVIHVAFTIGARGGLQQKAVVVTDSTGAESVLRMKIHLPPGPTMSSNTLTWPETTLPAQKSVTIELPIGVTYSINGMAITGAPLLASLHREAGGRRYRVFVLPFRTDRPSTAIIDLRTSDVRVFPIFSEVVP